ncbi:unnamed protein product [Penicillium olsonii]|uniref:xyloglucan-specific endo-beta-1,4-glucanase n=1 Tax=Penicillium olsonii TaxID=99116 RepID=A0A9W4I9I1_PENOL|nr:unnamed protein product [Penicillium olsonii]CAG8158350.1 unnamed protein product [Penicillium olsonii]CAG8241161.1 unnamed protein product [Penicillium olsonii]
MVVGVGLLVNAVLVAIPIGGSVGALMGIDAHRAATGQKPLFTGGTDEDSGGIGNGGSNNGGSETVPHDNGISRISKCDISYGIVPPSKTEQYTLNPNPWGVKAGSHDGELCMDVLMWNNATYPTNTAPEFSVTWQYDQGPITAPVHAYSNIRVDDVLPKKMSDVQELYVDLHWTYGVGKNKTAETTDVDALTEINLSTNVAIDMFLDSDKDKAENGTNAKFEVMVWFWMSSVAAQPHGWGKPGKNVTVEGQEFTLFQGENDQGTMVLSWVATPWMTDATEKFTGDIYPLIDELYSMSGDDYPSKDDYLGSLSFGTEAYDVKDHVTFWVPKYEISIKT